MSRQARQPKGPGKEPRPSVFYANPQQRERSRHLQCWRQAGIDPKKSGYQPTNGPCWVCEEALNSHSLAYLASNIARALQEWAPIARESSVAARNLAFALRKERHIEVRASYI